MGVVLRTELSGAQWAALVLLTGGTMCAEKVDWSDIGFRETEHGWTLNATEEQASFVLGASVLAVCACLSGLASVYTERILKAAHVEASIFASHSHMAFHSLLATALPGFLGLRPLPTLDVAPTWPLVLVVLNDAFNGLL